MNPHTKKMINFLHVYFLPHNLKYKISNRFSFLFATDYNMASNTELHVSYINEDKIRWIITMNIEMMTIFWDVTQHSLEEAQHPRRWSSSSYLP
jgi:hypothetical protein